MNNVKKKTNKQSQVQERDDRIGNACRAEKWIEKQQQEERNDREY